jgi:hypothetical protein
VVQCGRRKRGSAKETVHIVFPFGNGILDAGQTRDEENPGKAMLSQTRES